MNTHTDTFTNVTVHFDDVETSFSALQDHGGSLFVTEKTWASVIAEWPHLDDKRGVRGSLYDVSDWEVNFED